MRSRNRNNIPPSLALEAVFHYKNRTLGRYTYRCFIPYEYLDENQLNILLYGLEYFRVKTKPINLPSLQPNF